MVVGGEAWGRGQTLRAGSLGSIRWFSLLSCLFDHFCKKQR